MATCAHGLLHGCAWPRATRPRLEVWGPPHRRTRRTDVQRPGARGRPGVHATVPLRRVASRRTPVSKSFIMQSADRALWGDARDGATPMARHGAPVLANNFLSVRHTRGDASRAKRAVVCRFCRKNRPEIRPEDRLSDHYPGSGKQ
jgi:hypothetical protein